VIKNIDFFHQHVLQCYPQEAVCTVKNGIAVARENIHPDPVNNFALSKEVSLEVQINRESILHSHTFMPRTTEDARVPSYEDMVGRKSTNVPWGIVHCDGSSVSDILCFGHINNEPLLGRYYLHNVFDCFTLARDFLYKQYAYDVGLHPRPSNWVEWNPYYIEQTWDTLPFYSIPVNQLQYGDILLFNIGSNIINHIGIYTKDNKFIHHLHQRLSCEDNLSKWNKQFKRAIRYKHGNTVYS